MTQYQTFPNAAGDSRTLDKLKALRLPVMEGRSFLDVGCNEGFFCGFAKFAGATRAVGLDASSTFIRRARARFPGCEFHCQGWDYLPDGPFDVILLASALHYAEDQPALLRRLVDHLSRDGVLVLELGVAPSSKPEWVKVTRSIDERWFPSMMQLREVLAPYAFKWMGLSVNQAGDPIPRHVVHVSRRRPVAYLLMQPPAHGKTSLARKLFGPSGIPVVSGDLQVTRIAHDEIDVPPALREAIAQDFSPYLMDRSIERTFESGLGPDLVATWLAEAGEGDFAVDAYVPAAHQGQVRQCLVDAGYLPVVLEWDRVGPVLLAGPSMDRKATEFYRSLRQKGAPLVPDDHGKIADRGQVKGYVDRVGVADGKLVIGGWARDTKGQLPSTLVVRLKGRIVTCTDFDVVARPDVGKRFDTSQDRVGFRIEMGVDKAMGLSNLGKEFSVAPMGGRALRLTSAVTKLLGRS
jgi:SAM-dependent methyltransferase